MGSAKDTKTIIKPTESELGLGVFNFSDDFSAFDFGKMPDSIPGKGAALCVMSAFNFEMLEKEGIPTHYEGVLNNYGEIIQTTDLEEPSNRMAIKLAKVVKPTFSDGTYDYSFFTKNRGEIGPFVVPLEVIYRNGAPEGSSLFKKIEKLEEAGETDKLKSLLAGYGLTEKPSPGEMFPKTGYDYTTKFESTDRRITDDEAYEFSGLSGPQFIELENLRDNVVEIISKRASEVGFEDYDGKHEYIYSKGVKLADVVGTFDENRFLFNGEQVSKEFLRRWYIENQPEWCIDCESAKVLAISRGIENWQSLLKTQPKHLPEELVNLVGEMYMSGSDRYTGLNLFKTRPLEQVMEDIRLYRT